MPRTIPLCLAAVFAAILAAPAVAGDWRVTSRAFAEQRVTVDRESLKWQGDVATMWARIQAPKALTPPEASGPNALAEGVTPATSEIRPEALYLVQVACDARRVRLSTQSAGSGQVANPFGLGNTSPYTFQPLNSAVAWALYGGACYARPIPVAKADADTDPASGPLTPRRTVPRRNPWPLMRIPGS
ncbi:hypothetical protein [Sphingomonas morindae]|uniref:Uncharacterized protein n=1 Tax=Sphingomonas morindae TaxID=1541170 RepID=A0ABY4X6F3_9SPHN|nr:hypothetical protein [Sphingomonas morindae]USI72452.1 hypothetical protein LHA26_14315 [Sphingomonas morindae]